MSTLQVANVVSSGTITAGSYQTSGITVLAGNSTVTQLQVNSANAVVANSTTTLLTVGGTTTLTANTTGITSAGIVADSVGTIRPLVAMTANTVSGTAVDFTGIPSWVRKITVTVYNLSTSGTSIPEVRLGTASGVANTGYLGATTGTVYSDGFALSNSVAATNFYHGLLTIANVTGNTWACSGCIARSDGATTHTLGYSIALSAALTQLRFTMVNGTDTFDAGTVNVMYE